MSPAFRNLMAVIMLLAIVFIDFTSRLLSVGVDLLLVTTLVVILWPKVKPSKA
ncbi:hypothetical protein HNR62_001066 [Oceanisphaera litoralis]|uniref:DUF3927 family protein n=1 Tax=Oceanisphaera litoralis TaxID=225144 RepID=UPI00195DA9D4|nr:DUF3927 family protein [Oceanisphaera litoralis]MBM7455206.1 hypothetical protein [Oceanisphaera litoralis]